MVIVEWIYCTLLTDDNLLAFSPVALKRLHERISADDKICSLLACALEKNGNGVDEVVDYALQTFAPVRGSDYASKLLFRTGKSYATATHMDLKVKTESNKNKKATVGVISLPEYIDELGFDDSFLQECAAGLDEFIKSRMAEEDDTVRDKVDGDSYSVDMSMSDDMYMSDMDMDEWSGLEWSIA
jgi:hypothetical protein